LRWRGLVGWVNAFQMLLFAMAVLGLGLWYRHATVLFALGGMALFQCTYLGSSWIYYPNGLLLLINASIAPFILLGLFGHPAISWLAVLILSMTLAGLCYEGKRLVNFVWGEKLRRRELQLARRHVETLENAQQGQQHLSHEFLASLSREIRTPMNNVLGMLRLLSETELSQEQRRLQNIATTSGENIVLLIDELMDLSRIMGDKMVLDSAVFNIRQCIDATINLLAPMAYSKGTELTHVADPDIPLRVRGDSRRLSQVLANVIGFIIGFTTGDEICVNVHLAPDGAMEGLLRVDVTAKHALIPEQVQTEVQALLNHRKNIETVSPNYLGLEIARGIVSTMRGSMGLSVTDEDGVSFWISTKITLSTQQGLQSKTPDEFGGKRVLLVDMTPGLATTLSNDLDSWAMVVEAVSGYQKALELMRLRVREEQGFDIAILNMALAYVGSLKLSTIMAEDPVLSELPHVILCSVVQRAQSATIKHDRRIERCLFLTKPFSRGNLYHGLLELLEGRFEKELVTEDFTSVAPENNHRILLVEDNRVNQMVAQGILKRLGYNCDICETGNEALELLQEAHYDLVLMDCNLPDIDGYEVTRQFRFFERQAAGGSEADGSLRRTAVLALTANVSEGEEARCFAAGMDDYLTKPIQADKIAIRLRTWLEQAPIQSGVIHTRQASRNMGAWSVTNRNQEQDPT